MDVRTLRLDVEAVRRLRRHLWTRGPCRWCDRARACAEREEDPFRF